MEQTKKTEIQDELFMIRDKKYREFQAKLIPNIKAETIIGVRTPELKKIAKTILKDSSQTEKNELTDFLNALPHKYFEENQIHAFIISEIKDFEICLSELNKFLPFVDNWATCDQMSPQIFKKRKADLLPQIQKWIESGKTYSVRFAVKMLMNHFLDEDFKIAYPKIVSKIRSDEYYVKMMVAWYFATALAKQYDAILPFIQNKNLEKWTHNKAIQKAIESYRISPEQKEYLRGLKI